MNSIQPATTASRAVALRHTPPARDARVGEVIAWSGAGLSGTLHLQLEQRESGLHGVLVVDVEAGPPHASALRVDSVRMVGKGAPVRGTDVAIAARTGCREGDVIVMELGVHLVSAPTFLDVTFTAPGSSGNARPQRFTVAYRSGL